MNETLEDLEQKRKAVEKDIEALFETLQREVKTEITTVDKNIFEN